jgi:hypothetical protein
MLPVRRQQCAPLRRPFRDPAPSRPGPADEAVSVELGLAMGGKRARLDHHADHRYGLQLTDFVRKPFDRESGITEIEFRFPDRSIAAARSPSYLVAIVTASAKPRRAGRAPKKAGNMIKREYHDQEAIIFKRRKMTNGRQLKIPWKVVPSSAMWQL